ncbi:rap guanine nucleotide exchange factor 2 isoform X3 [Neodiprion lecontei]|uniref:Rap guanine nucleotide exchange factor 2 isoform X3 n=1 Tax=Neodiprion lecontei TaxID=441921 RepID=A0ABM3GQJ0_NEOLC|nr:rap guanine nucleotide exchange factor 2 isoform X3 [Neodiprion lecontei]
MRKHTCQQPPVNSNSGVAAAAAAAATGGIRGPVRRWNSFHGGGPAAHGGAEPFRALPRAIQALRSESVDRTSHRTQPPPPPSFPRRRFSVCFGKRTGGSARRPNECFVLEPSEMIVIDYPEVHGGGGRMHRTPHPITDHRQVNLVFDDTFSQGLTGRPELFQKSNRSSHSSDTSSAYSGSDTMTSVQSSLDADEVDLSGLVESIVDSDEEEDLAESMDSLTVRDTIRDCLEKDPVDRTADDIDILLEFTQHLKAFTNMTLAVRRALCAVMVFAVVERAGMIVLNDGEELDSWSVLINGAVEVEHSNGQVEQLQMGDSFGVQPTKERLLHRGVMKTKCDDCQFVCVTQDDYCKIQSQGVENTKRHEENGRVILVTELRGASDGTGRKSHVVIRGTPERLMLQLIKETSTTDPTYVDDFLLTHRTFIDNPLLVANQLLEWFTEPQVRDRVTRVVLFWVNNHFTDFETDPAMMEFLETFEIGLEKEKMHGQLRLLNIACAAKARTRNVTLTRPSRDEVLHFSILGGYERNFGIFISKVDKRSKAEDVGLKRGDQILEVNRQSFEHVSHAKALEILRGSTHLSITVKSNLLAFKEMLQTPDNSPRPRGRVSKPEITRLQTDLRLSTHTDPLTPVNAINPLVCNLPLLMTDSNVSPCKDAKKEHKGFMTLAPKKRLQKALEKMKILPKNTINDGVHVDDPLGPPHTPPGTGLTQTSNLYHSRSNPDLTTIYYDDRAPDYPEHVLKVYKADQTCKYLLVHKETTAHEVVMLALREFGITDSSSNFSLAEVSVREGGMIKQRQLADNLQNLAETIGLSSRYYLKTKGVSETLVADEQAPELVRESQVHFLHLNAVEVAIQLTLQDFSIFRKIESTEYVDDLFELRSRYGTPMLRDFAELVNREMFWVVTEICSEHNLVRRSKIIKQFIKIARQCKECKNFNSMFAIVSGLGHAAVGRLRATWEKLPTKYQRLFNDLEKLMDPSRNMSQYRQLIASEQTQPPIIPFYPVVKKDLTFIHLGNDSRVEGLINFEKLRMIAKEVRTLTKMCSSQYDLQTMTDIGGQALSSAMVSMNQMNSANQGGQTATVKRRKKSTAAPNPKKMFEEAQMVRRVKAYLANMEVITDEERLHALSAECEPHAGAVAIAAAVPLANRGRRHPSPTLSTTSSASSTSEGRKSIQGTKFGAASPQAQRKILALSDPHKTRPHQPKHCPAPLPIPGLALHAGGLEPSPGAPRRVGSATRVPMHERSHSDTPSGLPPPVDLSAESSSVTSLSNLQPLRKTLTSGSVTSSDSGHSTQLDSHSGSSVEAGGSPPPSQRRHSAMQGSVMRGGLPPFPHAVAVLPPLPATYNHYYHHPQPPQGLTGIGVGIGLPPGGMMMRGGPTRQPPAYKVAAQMARLHRLGRAHSHEGVTYHTDHDDDDEDAQVSAV